MKNWISSPVVISYLMSLCKNASSYEKRYLQFYKDLKIKKNYITSNQLFLSPSHNAEKQFDTTDITIENIQFGESKHASLHIMKWIYQYVNFTHVDLDKYVLPSTTSLLCNVTAFKGIWKCSRSNPIMTVHNSFSYTEDIKYEARLIELPMHDDDFKLVIIVPNDVSSSRELFSTLVDEGMVAAVSCVRPLFTFSTILEAPSIEFNSEHNVCFSKSDCELLSGVQLGNVQINDNGANISIITLLGTTGQKFTARVEEQQSATESTFHFAVLYKDAAIFTGRYVERGK